MLLPNSDNSIGSSDNPMNCPIDNLLIISSKVKNNNSSKLANKSMSDACREDVETVINFHCECLALARIMN